MKWLFKWLLRLALLAAGLVVLVLLFKDSVLRVVAENRIRARTGMDARIGRLSTGIFSPYLTIENLKIYNTAEFGGAPLLDIPEIHLECDRFALAEHRLRIRLCRINLAEFDIVKNEAGQTNFFLLKARNETSGSAQNRVQNALGSFEFDGIDVLNLSIGREKFIDLKDPKNNWEKDVNLQNQVFKNLRSDGDFLGLGAILYLRSNGKLSFGAPEPGLKK